MKTPWRWLVAGLVAAALLVGAGWWIGHRSVTVDRSAVQARADSLLGAAREAHRLQTERFAAEIAAAEARAAASAERARRAEAGRVAADATADSLAGVSHGLTAQLATAASLADTARIVTAQRDAAYAERDHALQQVRNERAIAADWKAAHDEQVRKGAVLLAQRIADSTRIATLEGLAEDLRKPRRLAFDLFGVRSECGPGVAFGTRGADLVVACIAKL